MLLGLAILFSEGFWELRNSVTPAALRKAFFGWPSNVIDNDDTHRLGVSNGIGTLTGVRVQP